MGASERREAEQAAKFKKELLSGTTSLVLLGLLVAAKVPMYGYEITRHLDARGEGRLPFQKGAVYPALRAMERQGLLKSSIAPSPGGPPRKYYRVTPAGERALHARVDLWRAVRDLVDAVLPDAADGRRSDRRVS